MVSPFLHTGVLSVCRNGHEEAENACHASAFAHAGPCRVQKRTHISKHRMLHVRFCTRAASPCAETDTKQQIPPAMRLFLHTGDLSVCKSGQLPAIIGPHVSVFAHARTDVCINGHQRSRTALEARFCTPLDKGTTSPNGYCSPLGLVGGACRWGLPVLVTKTYMSRKWKLRAPLA